jgi:hypothetical protein
VPRAFFVEISTVFLIPGCCERTSSIYFEKEESSTQVIGLSVLAPARCDAHLALSSWVERLNRMDYFLFQVR